MGVSFDNQVYLVCEKDESKWLESVPKRTPAAHFNTDCPIWCNIETMLNGFFVYLMETSGYGVVDLEKFELPASCVGITSAVTSCQGQNIDFVENIEVPVYETSSPYEEEKGHLYLEFFDNMPDPSLDDPTYDEQMESYDDNCRNTVKQLVDEGLKMWCQQR